MMVVLFGLSVPASKKYLLDLEREFFWVTKTHTDKKFDVIFVGDSRVYRGINPETFTQNSPMHLSSFNFGYSSATLDSLLLTKAVDKLDPHGKKIIAIAISPNALTDLSNDHFLQYGKMGREEILTTLYAQPIRKFFHQLSFHELKSFLTKKTNNNVNVYYIEHYNPNSGFVASNYIGDNKISTTLETYKLQTTNEVSNKTIDLLVKTVQRLTSNGYKVFGLRLPINKQLKKIENKWPNFDEQKINAMLSKAGANIISIDDNEYQTYDGSHLNAQSANDLSIVLSQIIK